MFPSHDPQTFTQFPCPRPIPWLGCCVPHCPQAPLLAAAGRRPGRAHSGRADHGRRVPVLGQGAPQGWTVASGACPLQTPGRARAVPAAQGAARGKRAGRNGRAAGAGPGPRKEEGAGSGGTGFLGNSLDINPLTVSACSPLLGILLPILPGKTPTHPSKLHHHAVPPPASFVHLANPEHLLCYRHHAWSCADYPTLCRYPFRAVATSPGPPVPQPGIQSQLCY